MDKLKIDSAIEFIENNHCMIESLISQEDDKTIVSYILNVLKHHKKNPQLREQSGDQGNY